MPKEKIGTNVLEPGATPPSRMPIKKRRELEQKLKEELAKKKAKEKVNEEEEKLPKLPIPDDQHIPKPGEPGWDKLSEDVQKRLIDLDAEANGLGLKGKDKDVFVREHHRSKPKKKEKSLADTVFEFL